MDGIFADFKAATVDNVKHTFHEMQRDGERASLWSVREIARRFNRAASKAAPVYRGPARNATYGGSLAPVVPGLLKKSFHSSKRVKGLGTGTFTVVAGPRGAQVRYYAAKQNERTGFVKAAYDTAVGEASAIHEKALDRALARSRR